MYVKSGQEPKYVLIIFFIYTLFLRIVSALEYFPFLNSFRTLVRKLFKFSLDKRKINAGTIRNFQHFTNSKMEIRNASKKASSKMI